MDMEFKVGRILGRNEEFHTHECTLEGDRVGMLKLATKVAYNGVLEREAYVLRLMRDAAAALEIEFEKVREDPKQVLNNHFFFPDLIDTFTVDEKEGRRALVSQFVHVPEGLSALVPLSSLPEKAQIRVDPKTSVWIVGKLLKMLTFTQNSGVSVGDLSGDNVLIHRKDHFVMVFDWSMANASYGSRVPDDVAREEISQVARLGYLILGGDPDTGELPYDEQLVDSGYEKMLFDLVRNGYTDAHKAHTAFYKLARAVWPGGYHPFTSYPL